MIDDESSTIHDDIRYDDETVPQIYEHKAQVTINSFKELWKSRRPFIRNKRNLKMLLDRT